MIQTWWGHRRPYRVHWARKNSINFYQASLSSQFHRFKSFNGAGSGARVWRIASLLWDDDLLLAASALRIVALLRSVPNAALKTPLLHHTDGSDSFAYLALVVGKFKRYTKVCFVLMSNLVKTAFFSPSRYCGTMCLQYLLQRMIIHSFSWVMNACLRAFFHTDCCVTLTVSPANTVWHPQPPQEHMCATISQRPQGFLFQSFIMVPCHREGSTTPSLIAAIHPRKTARKRKCS